jgi:hypothetical protein
MCQDMPNESVKEVLSSSERKLQTLPGKPESPLLKGLVHSMIAEEKLEREQLVRNLFETLGKLKARNSKRPSSVEVFSSQALDRVTQVACSPAQTAFKRTSIEERTALLNAFASPRKELDGSNTS